MTARTTTAEVQRARVAVQSAASVSMAEWEAASHQWEQVVAEYPSVQRFRARLRDLLEREPGRVYVRWSYSPTADRRRGYSLDHQTGQRHAGLSAVRVDPEWLDEPWYLVRRLIEYRRDARGWILVGDRVGIDSDGYDSVRPSAERWIALPKVLHP